MLTLIFGIFGGIADYFHGVNVVMFIIEVNDYL